MKRLLTLLAVLVTGCQLNAEELAPIAAPAPEPAPLLANPILEFLSHSNLLVAPYAVYAPSRGRFGAGIGLGYRVSDYVVPYIRFEQFNGSGWSPSGSIQAQFPIKIAGKITVIPMAWAGVTVSLDSNRDKDGGPIAVIGTGASIHLPASDNAFVPMSVLVGVEHLTGSGVNEDHILLGLSWKL